MAELNLTRSESAHKNLQNYLYLVMTIAPNDTTILRTLRDNYRIASKVPNANNDTHKIGFIASASNQQGSAHNIAQDMKEEPNTKELAHETHQPVGNTTVPNHLQRAPHTYHMKCSAF